MNFMGTEGPLIERALDLTAMNQKLIAQNIANINTPGYKAQRLKFDEQLNGVEVCDREDCVVRQDGNSVVMERERAELLANALAHRTFLAALANRAGMMRSAINGRA